jgi:hypothetical protein
MKYFGLAALALVMTASAFGSQINAFCNPTGTFAGGGGPAIVETCGSFTSLGGGTIGTGVGQDTITGVEIWFVADFEGGFANSNTVSVLWGAPSGGNFAPPAVNPCIVSGGGNSNANTCGIYSTNINAPGTTETASGLTGAALQTFAGTTFTTSVSSTVTSGSVQSSIGDTIVEYDYTVNQSTGSAPEPGSMILLGSGLLAAGLIGRKKFAK